MRVSQQYLPFAGGGRLTSTTLRGTRSYNLAAGNWTQQDALNVSLDRTAAFSLLTAPNAVAGIVAAVAFGAATERSQLGLTGPGCGLLGGFFGFAVTTALESLDVSVRG